MKKNMAINMLILHFLFFKILDLFIRLNNTVVDCKDEEDCSTNLVVKIAAVTLPEVLRVAKAASNKIQVFDSLRIFHETECHSHIKNVAINIYINPIHFLFFKFLDPFIRLNNTVVSCKDCNMDLVAKVAAVTLPEVSRVAKVGDNKVQILSDNIEVAERKAVSGVESRKEFLQFSEAKLCCAMAVVECLGICYNCYDTLKLELTNRRK